MIIAILILITISLAISLWYQRKQLTNLTEKLETEQINSKKAASQRKSQEVILGQITEQLSPFTEHFKYDPHLVKFLGQPIDYVYFGEDKIVFIEVKSGKARLSDKQVNIKKLVNEGKVYWDEHYVPSRTPVNEDNKSM